MRYPALFLPLSLAACAGSGGEGPEMAANTDRVPAARTLGPAERCLRGAQIQNTDVHSSQVIDFRLRDGGTWRNTLSAPCPGLAVERRFAYDTSTGQICRNDSIQVLRTGGGAVPGARCALGDFVPVESVGSGRSRRQD